MKRFLSFCRLLIVIGLLTAVSTAATVNAFDGYVENTTLKRLSYFIKMYHPNPFTKLKEDAFDSRIRTMEEEWEELSRDEAYYAARELVAALGDAHTSLSPAKDMSQPQLPFYAALIEGRWLIAQAQNAYPDLPGKELLEINGVQIQDICERLLPIISYESKEWAEVMCMEELCNLKSLRHIGVIEDLESVSVTVKDFDSDEKVSMTVEPVTEGYDYSTSTVVSYIPQTFGQSDYYYATLLEEGTLFIQYNVCAENPEMSMSAFADQIWTQMKEKAPKKMIVDLRHNSGGNSEVIKPLLSVLKDLQKEGSKLYCLIGSETMSSGLMAAADLKEAGAVLVGTPTGGIFGFGDVKRFELPDGFILNCSTKDFSGAGGWDGQIVPDIEVEQSMEDLRNQKDCAVEYIKSSP